MKTATGYAFVIPLAQKSVWTKYVSKAFKYDFYHTWDYQDLVKEGETMLFVYEEENDFIAFPLLKRAIPNSNYFDFHSVYGYTGPISNLDFHEIDTQFIQQFQENFIFFLKDQDCVSVFAKFHPFFNQTIALEKLGGVFDNGKTIAIDLKQPLESQRKQYRETTKQSIKKARKLGFTVREMQTKEDIAQFTNLYNQSMIRIGASGSYMFDEVYFATLLTSDQCNAKLVLVFYEDRMVCGSVVNFTKGILQAHLLATDIDYIKYSPAKLLIDEISLIGRENGMEYYHLGGGVGFKEDSLLEWKLGFSDLILPHKSWRFVVDQNAYSELVELTGNDMNDTVDFFPLYRLKQPTVQKNNRLPNVTHNETSISTR